MSLNPFDWLRHRTRQAVVDGVADALGVIAAPSTAPVPAASIEALQARIADALGLPELPAPAAAAPSKKGGGK